MVECQRGQGERAGGLKPRWRRMWGFLIAWRPALSRLMAHQSASEDMCGFRPLESSHGKAVVLCALCFVLRRSAPPGAEPGSGIGAAVSDGRSRPAHEQPANPLMLNRLQDDPYRVCRPGAVLRLSPRLILGALCRGTATVLAERRGAFVWWCVRQWHRHLLKRQQPQFGPFKPVPPINRPDSGAGSGEGEQCGTHLYRKRRPFKAFAA